ncbi:MAG: TRAP transporter small permease [Paracoccus denitrificans]|uniref:TRAP transporter small permease protein n=1 Tax=Paracoccus denitrificans TaxID=266 RepID=A0A533I8L4_PARDE|nr:MAG: TRAP transporter small permease [Paracoccus denitrificans]
MPQPRQNPVNRIFTYSEEIIAGTALLVLVAAVVIGVATRYVTRTPATWTGDISSLSFAWLVFVGGAAAFKYGMHMSIDLAWNLIPYGPRRYLGLVVDLFLLTFLAYATWLGISFTIGSIDDPMPILRWPRAWLYAAVPTGFAFMFLRFAGISWRRFRGDVGPTHRLPGGSDEEGGSEWA